MLWCNCVLKNSPFSKQEIYDTIRKREIVMPEEHTGSLGFEYAWKELLTRSRQAGRCFVHYEKTGSRL